MQCTCGHPEYYNSAIDNGLCNMCIAERLELLELLEKEIKRVKYNYAHLQKQIPALKKYIAEIEEKLGTWAYQKDERKWN